MDRPIAAPVPDPASRRLLDELRGRGHARPAADPALAWGWRDWLEDAVAGAGGGAGQHRLTVTPALASQALTCDTHLHDALRTRRDLSWSRVRQLLVGTVFRQWVTVGTSGEPLAAALAGLAAAGDPAGVLGWVAALPPAQLRRLRAEVAAHARRIRTCWPVPPASWMPRTAEQLAVPLCGGRVVLSAVADLVLGPPAGTEATVCIVRVEAGSPQDEHRQQLHMCALLQTLRSGAPPFRVATWYSESGRLDVDDVDDELLLEAQQRTVTAAVRCCGQVAGAAPEVAGGTSCRWCRPQRRRGQAPVAGVGRPPAGGTRASVAARRAG